MIVDPTTARDDALSHRDAALSPCRLSLGQTAGLRQLTLGNGVVRAQILLDKGANVRQFWHVPTETRTLAETSDSLEQLAAFARDGRRGKNYCDYFEGGWQDMLPARWQSSTASASASLAPQADADGETEGGVGEAAIVPWELTRSLCTPASASALCSVRLPDTGLEVVKRFTIRRRRAAMRVDTTVRSAAARDLHVAWTQHPALGGDLLDATSRVFLPSGHSCAARQGSDNLESLYDAVISESEERHGTTRSRLADDILPPSGSPDRFITIADIVDGEAALFSSRRDLGVRLRWDAATFPHVWLWAARRETMTCIAVEPSTTCLPELLAPPQPPSFHLLRPGEAIRAWVEISIIDSPPTSGIGG